MPEHAHTDPDETRGHPPSYPWYPRDYEFDEDVKLMTYEQEGIYRRLLDHQWFYFGLPNDPKRIAALCPKITMQRFLKLWPGISPRFKPKGGRLVNSKLERVRADLAEFKARRSAAGQAGANARWSRGA